MRLSALWGEAQPEDNFRPVDANLLESFRALLPGRSGCDDIPLDGIRIVSLGVGFQMFNAAFLTAPVNSAEQLAALLEKARSHFAAARRAWSFWTCEDWLSRAARRQLDRTCGQFGLRAASEMPGMIAETMEPPRRALPDLEVRRVADPCTLSDFTGIGPVCFHVPAEWYREVFDDATGRRSFIAWVGYEKGCPVATAATVTAGGVVGLYNVATGPQYRGRGIGEAITRFALAEALRATPGLPLVLQSSVMGLNLYSSIGFRSVTRFKVFNS